MTTTDAKTFLYEWGISLDDARRIYASVRGIANDIDRMVRVRENVAQLCQFRGIPFGSFQLYDETPQLDRAIMTIGRSA